MMAAGDGIPDYAICTPSLSASGGIQTVLFASILASMTQTTGMKQGFLLDPLTMGPLVSDEAAPGLLFLKDQQWKQSNGAVVIQQCLSM